MPEYDPKSIPILDDVIENDSDENADALDSSTENQKTASDTTSAENPYAESSQSDDNLDLFSDRFTGLTAEAPVIDQAAEEPSSQESEKTESALIDYSAVTEQEDITETAPSIETLPQTTAEPVSLEAIVDEIAKQLIPDLEQQLRYLIQKALEDRLPDEIIARLSGKDD